MYIHVLLRYTLLAYTRPYVRADWLDSGFHKHFVEAVSYFLTVLRSVLSMLSLSHVLHDDHNTDLDRSTE